MTCRSELELLRLGGAWNREKRRLLARNRFGVLPATTPHGFPPFGRRLLFPVRSPFEAPICPRSHRQRRAGGAEKNRGDAPGGDPELHADAAERDQTLRETSGC